MAGSLAPVMYWDVCTTLGGRAVAILSSGATCQDAPNRAAVQPFEDLRTHAKSFQSPEVGIGFIVTSS